MIIIPEIVARARPQREAVPAAAEPYLADGSPNPYQTRCTVDPRPSDVVYHGLGGHNVAVEKLDGEFIRALPHKCRSSSICHSPTGFSWGYAGSGPAELARWLLIDAFGELAICPRCAGTHKVVWADGEPEPWVPGSYADDVVSSCQECDDGWRRLPYQKFKFRYVAGWPQHGEWRITRKEILAWLWTFAQVHPRWRPLAEAVRGGGPGAPGSWEARHDA